MFLDEVSKRFQYIITKEKISCSGNLNAFYTTNVEYSGIGIDNRQVLLNNFAFLSSVVDNLFGSAALSSIDGSLVFSSSSIKHHQLLEATNEAFAKYRKYVVCNIKKQC